MRRHKNARRHCSMRLHRAPNQNSRSTKSLTEKFKFGWQIDCRVVIDVLKRSITKENVKALMSVGDAWKQSFINWVGDLYPQ